MRMRRVEGKKGRDEFSYLDRSYSFFRAFLFLSFLRFFHLPSGGDGGGDVSMYCIYAI